MNLTPPRLFRLANARTSGIITLYGALAIKEENSRFLFVSEQPDTRNVQATLAKAGFNPFEARDYRGWWTRSGQQGDFSPTPEQIGFNGHFHNLVLDDFVNNLIAGGAKAIKQIEVTGINGVSAIPDAAALIPGINRAFFIEVKTGLDSDFTGKHIQ